ncbi:3-phosphoglycerate dehydrogenase [Imbroritus primus]|uniref:3-phosphoglycerate dehydrogenase n=1 Tax=Imbroritus primus TaxID=3058603 RepID=A0ACD3SLA1_9BURK|nr:3-phosphoglycerate dehydrogenase [Burkholderiaceae bacterium PBA]
MKIVIPEALLPGPLAQLQARHTVHYDPALVNQPEPLIAAARDADCIIIRNRTQLRGALLDAMTRCRVVGRQGVGLDNIDMDVCRARGIEVIPAIGANARSVAEYVMTTAMMLLRGAYGASAEVAAGTWPRAALGGGREIFGRTLGVVGFGSIGQVTAALARRMDMRVVAYDPMLAADAPALREHDCALLPLEELLAVSDVVTLHMPLLPQTHHLLDAQRLACMRADAVLINAARGGTVDEAALAAALRAGRLHGAALDVFETEPLGPGSVLADVPNLLLTPHIGGVTADSEVRVSDLVTARVLAALEALE